MVLKKSVRIVKKICEDGVWKFVSLKQVEGRYQWDQRPGQYFLDWWEGDKRRREFAGASPSQALTAQKRKRMELVGAIVLNGNPTQAAAAQPPEQAEAEDRDRLSIEAARQMFLAHVATHSPDKPETHRRYAQVMRHFERLVGHRRWVEAITRADLDEYKTKRKPEKSERTGRPITAQTINFELGTVRTFFYFLINERGMDLENPCEKYKKLKDANQKSKRRPPTYSQEELDALFAACDEFERAVFGTLLLTGLRKSELYFLTWKDVDFRTGVLSVTGEGKVGFSPKDYEIREIPMPPDVIEILRRHPRTARWVFPNRNGRRLTHLLRRLKTSAKRAGVQNATLHKFRHTYCTRLLETGTDIVTVKNLMGHSDIKTTMRYLNPRDELKHSAACRLSLGDAISARRREPAQDVGAKTASGEHDKKAG
jgi:integrase